MTMRGLIKIEPGGGAGLSWSMASAYDLYAEYAPIMTNFTNWLQGRSMSYGQQEQLENQQRFGAYLQGGYAVYGEELEQLFHGKQTEGYMGLDTTQKPTTNVQAAGASINYEGTYPEVVKTNEQAYREIKFKTTISIRDPDLPTGWVAGFRQGNMMAMVTGELNYGLDLVMGGQGLADMKAYFQKRATFLRDLDDVEVTVSSLMFTQTTGYINADRMTMQAGQTEAQFDVQVTEVVKSIVAKSADSFHAVTNEPGLGFS